ncbi:hypothetical protein MKK68_21145 [Methylobacterium sp. E-016]|uniref:hypothetical protein n=1 Tax=Methylobacterium sp. E-016 TaxID=2836556 RepID=UPI001FBB50A6|nr:hypothetical protein [Methylobacterium sp. E-016]MCJ2078120.1 hypothetical protein [Methylobacterium sp. E-016]
MSMTTTAALTRRRYEAEAAVAEAKVAAQVVLDFAPGPDTDVVVAARVAARRAASLALAMVEVWAEEERDRAEAALLGEGDAEACHAVLAFEF